MDILKVREKIRDIKAHAGDDEAQHCIEDDMYLAVLEAIAAGKAEDPKRLAKAALKARKLDFYRWCA